MQIHSESESPSLQCTGKSPVEQTVRVILPSILDSVSLIDRVGQPSNSNIALTEVNAVSPLLDRSPSGSSVV